MREIDYVVERNYITSERKTIRNRMTWQEEYKRTVGKGNAKAVTRFRDIVQLRLKVFDF